MNDATMALMKRHGIGFDFTHFDAGQNTGNFPPHNIEQIDENHFRLTLAVAGFKPEELSVTVERKTLSIVSKRAKVELEDGFMHRGIAFRDFTREFRLMENVDVLGGYLENGLLIIDLERVIPEAEKPRRIEISSVR